MELVTILGNLVPGAPPSSTLTRQPNVDDDGDGDGVVERDDPLDAVGDDTVLGPEDLEVTLLPCSPY